MPARARITLALTLLLLSSAATVHAQCWSTTTADDTSPVIIGDGATGYYLMWQYGLNTGLTHVSSGGTTSSWTSPWGPNESPNINKPIMASDQSGGLFTANEGTIRRYHTNAGQFFPNWTNPLVPNGANPQLTSDPAGDAYVAIRVPGTKWSIKVARLGLADGVPVWPPVTIQNASYNLDPVRIAHRSDNTFVLFRNFDPNDPGQSTDHLWVQKFNSAGVPQWGATGALVRNHDNDGLAARMVADNAGGCFVLFADREVHPGTDAYRVRVEHLDMSGTPQWSQNPELAGIWSEWGSYPGYLYLGLYSNGDLLTCYSRPDVDISRAFRARRLAGSGPYSEVWLKGFEFPNSSTSYGTDLNVSEIDDFDGVSIVYSVDIGAGKNIRGRYLTQRGSLTEPGHQIRENLTPFSNSDPPRPYAYSRAGAVVGVWSEPGVQSTVDICGNIEDPWTFSGWTVIQGIVHKPDDCSEQFTVKAFLNQTQLDETVIDAEGKYELNVPADQAAGVTVSVVHRATLVSVPAVRTLASSSWLSNADFTLSYPTDAVWGTPPVPVSTTLVDANHHRAVRAADGSLFVTWVETRCVEANEVPYQDVFVQKFDNSGDPLWTPNGVVATTTAENKFEPTLAVDGTGGVFVAFHSGEESISDIVVQHLLANGSPAALPWTNEGQTICDATGGQRGVQAVADNLGGVLLAWMDERSVNTTSADVYAQRISSSGAVAWETNGVPVCNAPGIQHHITVASDRASGMVVAWEDERNDGDGGEADAYAQRVLETGVVSWTPGGVPLSNIPGHQRNPKVVVDDDGRAFVVWTKDGVQQQGYDDIMAQRINSNGSLWDLGGKVVHDGSDDYAHDVCPDNAGGIYVVWAQGLGDERVRAQRLDTFGNRLWPSGGYAVASGSGSQTQPVVSANAGTGIMVAWTDRRSGNEDVYAQRMTWSGSLQWGAGGVAVEALAGDESDPLIITRGTGVAHVVWRRTSGGNEDLYATLVGSSGGGGGGCTKNCPTRSSRVGADTQLPTGIISSYPNPFRAGIQIHFALQKSVEPEIGVFDVQGRQLVSERLAEHQPGAWQWTWNGENAAGQRADAGVYFVKMRLGSETFTRRVIKINH